MEELNKAKKDEEWIIEDVEEKHNNERCSNKMKK